MTVADFIAKWRHVALTERPSAQTHFIDPCRLVQPPDPVSADPAGDWFTFERGASKATGGEGWAGVWKRGYFGWEYKGRHKDLMAAYAQLLLYQGALENPPLLIVCSPRVSSSRFFTGSILLPNRIDTDIPGGAHDGSAYPALRHP